MGWTTRVSAIVRRQLFVLSPDTDIILQESLPLQLFQKVQRTAAAGYMRVGTEGWGGGQNDTIFLCNQ